MTTPRHAGVPIDLDGTPHVLPPLTLGAIEDYEARIKQAGAAPPPGLVIDLLHRALRRNYPELTREQVAEGVDLQGMAAAFRSLMGVSGFAARVEDGGEGNPTATAPGTGAPSMPTSPPVSAGASSTAASTSP